MHSAAGTTLKNRKWKRAFFPSLRAGLAGAECSNLWRRSRSQKSLAAPPPRIEHNNPASYAGYPFKPPFAKQVYRKVNIKSHKVANLWLKAVYSEQRIVIWRGLDIAKNHLLNHFSLCFDICNSLQPQLISLVQNEFAVRNAKNVQ